MSSSIKPVLGSQLSFGHPLSTGLVGLWLLNEGSGNKVFDLSGNGNTGALQGTAPSWGVGKFGSAILLPGTDEYISFGDLDDFNFERTDKFTIVFLVKITDTSVFQVITSKIEQTGDYNGWGITNLSGNIQLLLRHDADPEDRLIVRTTNAAFFNNVWTFGALTYTGTSNSSGVSFYVNGISVGKTVVDENVAASVKSIDADFQISGRDGANNLYNGLIDYVMIYNRALLASEIALLYREPFCMFDRAWRPGLIGGQIVELAGTSAALSSVEGSLSVSGPIVELAGTAAGTSNVNGHLSLLDWTEASWLTEALFNGMTANAFKLGTTLSLGWFWVRAAGCSVLYRGPSMGEIDFVNILAVAEQDEYGGGEISPPNYIPHNSGSTYFYVVRRFNNCGYQECTLAASVKVSMDFSGELAQPQPNKVFDSGAELVDGNKIKLVWYYCPLEQKSQPVSFNVYYDGRSGQINYENPLAIIGYKGRKFYSYQSDTLEAGDEGDEHLFAIRAEDVSGIENSSLSRLKIQFDPINPDAIDILSAEGV